jgi:hypothetical protein
MLSKNEVDLLYPLVWTADSVGDVASGGFSPIGEPAMASLTKSSLLNLAFDDSKSKSVVGTSFVGATLDCPPPLPPRPLVWTNPAPPGCLGARIGSVVLISLTFLVKLSTALPFVCVCPAGGSFAIAAATAAVAACVAAIILAALSSAGLAAGTALPCCMRGGDLLAAGL